MSRRLCRVGLDQVDGADDAAGLGDRAGQGASVPACRRARRGSSGGTVRWGELVTASSYVPLAARHVIYCRGVLADLATRVAVAASMSASIV